MSTLAEESVETLTRCRRAYWDGYSGVGQHRRGMPYPHRTRRSSVNYAKWSTRVVGYVVDTLVILPFFALAWVVQDRPGWTPVYVASMLLGFAVEGYNRWFLSGRTGQSWGRKAVGIRLVSARTGRPIGAFKAFVRDLAHFLDGITANIGYLFPLWTAKRQTFADMAVKTVVVT
jgi:uncharacterized RDD family membrane protein YckC